VGFSVIHSEGVPAREPRSAKVQPLTKYARSGVRASLSGEVLPLPSFRGEPDEPQSGWQQFGKRIQDYCQMVAVYPRRAEKPK
jgi:hypothetical protein